jgi:hypothetical protein
MEAGQIGRKQSGDHMEIRRDVWILLKNLKNASTKLSMNGKSPMISTAPPFVLRLSKDERGFFSRIVLAIIRSACWRKRYGTARR